jgi:hypothetical protein
MNNTRPIQVGDIVIDERGNKYRVSNRPDETSEMVERVAAAEVNPSPVAVSISDEVPIFASLFFALSRARISVDFRQAVELAQRARFERKRFFFIGNGGSAAIASHMSADWLKAAGVAAMSFNEAAQITCIANDLGYEYVFAKPLLLHA